MKMLGVLCCLVLISTSALSQDSDPKVILITLDGFRWQELFEGPDSILSPGKDLYWNSKAEARRRMLMPFMWNEIASNGQLVGNRNFNNKVNCDNPHWFSYPGYNEMFTGFVDRRVKSNEKIVNPNMTVFEFISQQEGYKNKVAAFGTWGVFPYIFREDTSNIFVNAGDDVATGEITEREQLLNELQSLLPNPVTERHDVFTAFFAMEYMKREHPKAVFIGLDETDSYAHAGKYDQYLHAAHRADEIIKRIWNYVQSDPYYRDNTTLIITTDHGRGRGYWHDKLNWRSHGRLAFGSGEVWVAALGPGIAPLGENRTNNKYTLSQVASTITAVLGMQYINERNVAPPIDSLVPKRSGAVASNK
ncbi:MAG: alkaline phosphatase family protein [Bacteroidota bacterium]